MFARMLSQILGEAECGICGVRGKPAASSMPFQPMLLTISASPEPLDKTATCIDEELGAVSYPTGLDCAPLSSFAFSRECTSARMHECGRNSDAEEDALYATELLRCRKQLTKDLQRESRRSRHQSALNALAGGNLLQLQESIPSLGPTASQALAPFESSLVRALKQQDVGAEQGEEKGDSSDEALDNARAIDALYDKSAVRKQALHIRRKMLYSDPCPDMIGMHARIATGPHSAERKLRLEEQVREKTRVQAGIDGFQASIREKIERDGVSSAPLAPFRRVANPAEAVFEGVSRYHDQCEDADVDQTFMHQYQQLNKYRDDLE